MPTLRLYPTGDNSNTDWVTAPLWSKVDEATLNEADYITSDTWKTPVTCTFNWTNHGSEVGAISDVIIYAQAKRSNTTYAISLNFFMPNGSYKGSDIALNSTSTLHSRHHTTNPATGVAWTWDDIDNLLAGLYATAYAVKEGGSTVPYVYQTYIDVVYTAPATVTTQSASSITTTGFTGNGNITNTGGEGNDVTRRGFCYKAGTSGDPTTADSVVYDDGAFGTGAYTKAVTGLSPATDYRVRAYAVNAAGTVYGDTVQVTTIGIAGCKTLLGVQIASIKTVAGAGLASIKKLIGII